MRTTKLTAIVVSTLLVVAVLNQPSSAYALNSDAEPLTELSMNEQTFPAGTDPEMLTFITNEQGVRKYAPLKCGKMYTYQGTGGTFTLQRACTPGNRAESPYAQWGIKLNANNVRRAISPAKEKMFWKAASMKGYQGLAAHNGAPAGYHFHGTFTGIKTGHNIHFYDNITFLINGPRGVPQVQLVRTEGWITFTS